MHPCYVNTTLFITLFPSMGITCGTEMKYKVFQHQWLIVLHENYSVWIQQYFIMESSFLASPNEGGIWPEWLMCPLQMPFHVLNHFSAHTQTSLT